MLTSKAAKRYAKAFFSLAQDKGKLDEVRADFNALAELAAQSEELTTFLSSPLVAQDKRLELLKSLFEGKIGATAMSFVTFLNQKDRTAVLAEVCEQFEIFCNEAANVQLVTITSAQELEASQVKAIEVKLEAKLGKTIKATNEVDASLIGGFKIAVGDEVIDHSITAQLSSLKQSIVNA